MVPVNQAICRYVSASATARLECREISLKTLDRLVPTVFYEGMVDLGKDRPTCFILVVPTTAEEQECRLFSIQSLQFHLQDRKLILL